MSTLETNEGRIAWELRDAWLRGLRVSVRLNEAVCVIARVRGVVVHVDATGAHADVLDDADRSPWRISCSDVLNVRRPHFTEPADRAPARREASAPPLPEDTQLPGQTSLLELLADVA